MTHEQIDRMVRKANPVLDPSQLESVAVPVLTTTLERRMDMLVDDRPPEVQADRNRWRGPLVGIAAAVAVLVAGLAFVLARNDTPVAEPAPNATRLPEPGQGTIGLEPGAYFVDPDGDPSTTTGGTFVIEGQGWMGSSEGVDRQNGVSLHLHQVDEPYSPGCEPIGNPMPAGSTAADLADGFSGGGFIVREAPAPVNAFGYEGYHVVVEVPEGCNGGYGGGKTHILVHGGDVVEAWLFDMGGHIVMVEAMWFAGLPEYTESPEEDLAELRAVLDTLVITP